MMIKAGFSAMLWAGLLLMSNLCGAEGYPSKPIKIIVPLAPGTVTNLVARLAAPRLSKSLQVPVVVENRVGASSQIGAQAVARAVPDGYTLLFTSPAHYINMFLHKDMPYDPIKDFRPVMRMSDTLLVLVVPQAAPVRSVKELIEYVRAHPGKFDYSSSGSGTSTHLPAVMFNSRAGLDIVHVPYKSGADALSGVIGGQVLMTFTGLATAMPHIKSGTLKALAVTGMSRSASMPDIPTIAEAGEMPGYDFSAWGTFFAPAGLSDEILEKLETTLLEISNEPYFKKQILAIGAELEPMSSNAFHDRLKKELPVWEKAVADGAVQTQ